MIHCIWGFCFCIVLIFFNLVCRYKIATLHFCFAIYALGEFVVWACECVCVCVWAQLYRRLLSSSFFFRDEAFCCFCSCRFRPFYSPSNILCLSSHLHSRRIFGSAHAKRQKKIESEDKDEEDNEIICKKKMCKSKRKSRRMACRPYLYRIIFI